VGDAHQLNFENNSFDVVIASWILVYSKNQQQLLSELRRVIKPKTGLAIITGDHSLSPHNPIPNYGTNSGYVFDSANIKKYWPMRNDDFLIQWPSHTPVIGGTAQVIVAIQKSSDQWHVRFLLLVKFSSKTTRSSFQKPNTTTPFAIFTKPWALLDSM